MKRAGLTVLTLVVLEGLEGHEGGTTGEELVGELGLVVRLVGLLVVVACLVWSRTSVSCRQQCCQNAESHTETEHLGCVVSGLEVWIEVVECELGLLLGEW